MVQPRASRRRVVAISDDEEEPETEDVHQLDEDEEPVKPQKRSTGKLKPVKKSKTTQQPTPATSTQEASPQKSPARQRASKAKSKTAVKDAPKPNAKPIYSFFNAATQRQRASQPSASPEKPATPDEPEAIHDDSGEDGSTLAYSKGSSTALALRKRKVQHSTSFEDSANLAPSATQKFRKTSDGGRTPSFSVVNDDKRPWTEQFGAVDLSELAVHKKKVADVRQWLETSIAGRRQKVLVLKGPAGAGKTATVRLLAQDLQLHVFEWRNPAGVDNIPDGSLSTAAQFEDFVSRGSRGYGLTMFSGNETDVSHVRVDDNDSKGPDRQLLLIEEFPNTFSRTSSTLQSFRSAIAQYVASPPIPEGTATPIVMIISETLLSTNTAAADSFTAHRLLGPELVNHPYVNTIEFNPVATTILTKALETIVVKEARKSGRRKTPGPLVLKRLAETGDIRSAVSALEFLCLRGDDGDTWSSKVHFTKPKKKSEPALTKAEEEALKLVSNRENSLGIFHAVGRIMYNNRVEPAADQRLPQPPPWLPQHRRAKVPERNIDNLIDELGTDVSTFIAALHENYALSCSGSSAEDVLDSLSGCMDNVSDADLLSVDRFSSGTRAFSGTALDSLRQDEMAFQTAVRGLLFNLPSPVHRIALPGGGRGDAFRMFYPASLKLWKAREEVEDMLELLTERARHGKLGARDSAVEQRPGASESGVESWKRRAIVADVSRQDVLTDGDASEERAITKAEMLLERLPYLAQVLSSQQKRATDSTLVDQILSVSRVTGSTAIDVEEEEEAAEDNLDAAGSNEVWATDRPDVEAKTGTKSKPRSKGKQKQETEGGGLSIPVESRVENLVLQDDDIVDD